MLKLLPDWQVILKKAWSIRFMVLAFLFTMVEVSLPFFEHKFPQSLFAALTGLSVGAAFVTRLLAQKENV
jgi:uncharacterized membrane protein YoaK (UPF0700 family)